MAERVRPPAPRSFRRAPECPEIFELGGRWYLLYSTYSDRFATRYRIGTSPSGPWHRPAWDAIDANDAYAMKTVSNGERRYAIGWLATRSRDRDAGHRQWGGDLVVHELHPRSDGSLGASPVAGLLERFVTRPVVPDPRQGAWSTALGAASFDGGPFGWASLGEVGETALVDVTIDARDRPEEFGIALRAAPDFGSSYLVRIEFDRGRVVFDRRPHTVDVPFDQNSDRSYVSASDHEIERPLIAPDGAVRVRVIVDGSAILAYINDVALTTRGYDIMGGEFAVYAANGPLRVESAQVGRLVDTGRADAG